MSDASCRSDDVVDAFEELVARLAERRRTLWNAYNEATRSMTRSEYEIHENECWSVLHAGLSGIDAEERVLRRDFAARMTAFDEPGAISESA